MKIFAVLASSILVLGLATGGTSAKDATGQTNFRQIIEVLAAQQSTAQVDALRAAVAGNRRLVDELRSQHIEYMNIVVIDIGQTGKITVYTFGASV